MDSIPDDLRLGALLLQRGLLTPSQLRFGEGVQASLAQRGRAAPLAEVLVHHGLVTPEQLHETGEAPVSPPVVPSLARLTPQARFGRFEIERLLGEGAMGVVYLALDPTLQRRVALKVLKTLSSPAQLERFPREARAAASLSHPSLVRIHEAGQERGVPYLVMDLVESAVALDVYAQREGLRAFLVALEQVARGVQHAHEQGVCHRDLKPENVLVDAEGRPVVTDFGLALFVNQGSDEGQRLTKTGQVLGTPLYMAPEQFVGDLSRIGPASDVWSLGVMLYEGAAGAPPFSGVNFMELLTEVVSEEAPPPSRLAPGLSRDLDTICHKALEKDPRARFPDAGAFADELARHLSGEPLLTRPLGPGARLLRAAKRRKGTIAYGGILLALATLAALPWLSSRPRPTPHPSPSLAALSSPATATSASPRASLAESRTRPATPPPWAKILEPEYLALHQSTIRDQRRASPGHALSIAPPAQASLELLMGTSPSLAFQTTLSPSTSSSGRARAEIRLRGADLTFADLPTDAVYYTQLDLLVAPESEPFLQTRTDRGDWNNVWQCAQIGAAPPHFYRVSSPPISLQLYQGKLFVRTYSDYAKYTADLTDEAVYRKWRRTRGPQSEAPEFGETTRDGVQPAKVRRRPLALAGPLEQGRWNRVFMAFRLGEQGMYRVWVNGVLGAEFTGPIGYRCADDFSDPHPKLEIPGLGPRIKKRASVRFGLYQGYGDPSAPQNPTTRSKVLVRRFALGTDEEAVRGS